MPKKYILDTDTCIYWLKGDRNIEKKVLRVDLDNVFISVITECELHYGAYKSTRIEHNLDVLKMLRKKIKTLQTSGEMAHLYGKIKAHMEKIGYSIDDADLMIAVITLSSNGILVTNNTRHYIRVPDLQIENWRSLR